MARRACAALSMLMLATARLRVECMSALAQCALRMRLHRIAMNVPGILHMLARAPLCTAIAVRLETDQHVFWGCARTSR